jgi:hypothetical protein
MTIYHKHHIIPEHMGGTDDPSNLVEVTVEQHAELHKQLWEDLGHWQDKIAWQTLSGQINPSEASILAWKEGCKKGGLAIKGKKLSEETKRKISLTKMGNKSRLGMPHSEETKRKMSENNAMNSPEKRAKLSQSMMGNKSRLGMPHSEETKRKISEALRNKKH